MQTQSQNQTPNLFARARAQLDASQSADIPRRAMVLVAVVLAALLYAVTELEVGALSERMLMAAWVGACAGGGFFLMTARCGQWLKSAAQALLVGSALAAIAANVWGMSGADALGSTSGGVSPAMLAAALASCAVLWAMAVSWMQAIASRQEQRLAQTQRQAQTPTEAPARIYPHLFQHAWSLAPLLSYVATFVALVWAVLFLAAGLLALLGVRVGMDVLTAPPFVFIATAAMVGLGAAIMRAQAGPVAVKLRIVLALAHVLTPLVAAAMVLVAAAVAVRGVELLWATGHAAVLLSALQVLLIVFINGVYQDGEKFPARTSPYARWVDALVHAALLTAPVLGAIAVWAVMLRVQQYGWTVQRVWAVAGTGVLLAYSSWYALVALRGVGALWGRSAANQPLHADNVAQLAWMGGPHGLGIGTANRYLSVLLMLLLVALNTDWAAPVRIAAHSQAARLAHKAQTPGSWDQQAARDWQALRFDHGRWGREMVAAAVQRGVWAHDAQAHAWLKQLEKASTRGSLDRVEAAAWTRADAPALIAIAPGHPAPSPALWDAIWVEAQRSLNCLPRHRPPTSSPSTPSPASAGTDAAQLAPACVVLHVPLRLDRPEPLPLLCDLGRYGTRCLVFEPTISADTPATSHPGWQKTRTLRWFGVPSEKQAAFQNHIRAGRLQITPPVWANVHVEGFEDQHAELDR